MPTRTAGGAADRKRRGRWGARGLPAGDRRAAIALAGFFLLLAASAWPALLHHARALQGNLALEAIEAGRPLTEAGLERAFSSRREALAALENNRARRELGQAHLRRARDEGRNSAEKRDAVEAAAQAVRAALARAPADHFAWYHLALAEALAEREHGAARALATAYGFARYHPPIRDARIELGLVLWPALGTTSRSMVFTDLAEASAEKRR